MKKKNRLAYFLAVIGILVGLASIWKDIQFAQRYEYNQALDIYQPIAADWEDHYVYMRLWHCGPKPPGAGWKTLEVKP